MQGAVRQEPAMRSAAKLIFAMSGIASQSTVIRLFHNKNNRIFLLIWIINMIQCLLHDAMSRAVRFGVARQGKTLQGYLIIIQ